MRESRDSRDARRYDGVYVRRECGIRVPAAGAARLRQEAEAWRFDGLAGALSSPRVGGRAAANMPGAIARLQQAAGNQNVTAFYEQVRAATFVPSRIGVSKAATGAPDAGERVRHGLVVQRAPDGLARKKTTSGFAGAVLEYWLTPANKGNSFQDLGDVVMKKANEALKSAGAPVCDHSFDSSDAGAIAGFLRRTWSIELNPNIFTQRKGVTTVGDLNQAEVGKVVDSVYHEARHSEQYYRLARVLAGKGKTAAQIVAALKLPEAKAVAAGMAPLKSDRPSDNSLIEEASAWEPSTVGGYKQYWNMVERLRRMIVVLHGDLKKHDSVAPSSWTAVRSRLSKMDEIHKWFAETDVEISSRGQTNVIDQTVQSDIKSIGYAYQAFRSEAMADKPLMATLKSLLSNLFDAWYNAYSHDPLEIDASTVGAAAGGAFNALANEKKTPKAK